MKEIEGGVGEWPHDVDSRFISDKTLNINAPDGRVAEICRISPPVLISELVEGCIAAHPDSAQVPLAGMSAHNPHIIRIMLTSARCGNRTSLRAVPKDIIEEGNEYKTVLGQLLESGTLNTRL